MNIGVVYNCGIALAVLVLLIVGIGWYLRKGKR